MANYIAKEVKAVYASKQEASQVLNWNESWIQGSNDWLMHTFLQHDLSGLPYKSKIISAKLKMYESWKNDNGANGTTNVARVTEDWSDNTLTWNNKPASTGRYLAEDVPPPGVGNWTDWDITSLVQEWVNEIYPNYGLRIVNNDEGKYRVDWRIYNRRYSQGEYGTYIEIIYNPGKEYRVTETRMLEFGDEIRRITETTESLNPEQMVNTLSELEFAEEVQF